MAERYPTLEIANSLNAQAVKRKRDEEEGVKSRAETRARDLHAALNPPNPFSDPDNPYEIPPRPVATGSTNPLEAAKDALWMKRLRLRDIRRENDRAFGPVAYDQRFQHAQREQETAYALAYKLTIANSTEEQRSSRDLWVKLQNL